VRQEKMRELELQVRMERLQEALDKNDEEPKESSTEKRHREWEEWFAANIPRFTDKVIKSGADIDKAIRLIAREDGMSANAILYFRREKMIPKYNLDKLGNG
jgi:hypothetical protein